MPNTESLGSPLSSPIGGLIQHENAYRVEPTTAFKKNAQEVGTELLQNAAIMCMDTQLILRPPFEKSEAELAQQKRHAKSMVSECFSSFSDPARQPLDPSFANDRAYQAFASGMKTIFKDKDQNKSKNFISSISNKISKVFLENLSKLVRERAPQLESRQWQKAENFEKLHTLINGWFQTNDYKYGHLMPDLWTESDLQGLVRLRAYPDTLARVKNVVNQEIDRIKF